MKPTNLIEGQWESNLSPAMIEQAKKESNHSSKEVQLPDLSHASDVDRTMNPNFLRDFDEGHHQPNMSSFHETTNRREINSQRNLISRRIYLEESEAQEREGIKLRRPKRLKQNTHSTTDNTRQYLDQSQLKLPQNRKPSKKIYT